jgi:hypothetical protein
MMLLGIAVVAPSALASTSPVPGFANRVIASGSQLQHAVTGGSEQLSKPDDITFLGGRIFVAFQNGVGPQGEASATGNVNSTVVEFTRAGRAIKQWDITGKCDGIAGDPATGKLIATVNEDANSSLYTIDPVTGAIVHYEYNEPLPSAGGTDAISVEHGTVLISASAPGTTGLPAPQAAYPAVYQVGLDPNTSVATIHPLFGDEATANEANIGPTPGAGAVTLMLTDPDSSETVPLFAPRFGGDFMLTSQGDQQQIFASDPGQPDQSLSVLNLSTAVDDTAWPSAPRGALYVTDGSDNTINRVVGPFHPGTVLVAATPCSANSAPSTCPAPGFPPNFLGELNPWTGAVTPVPLAGPMLRPQGMLFIP